MKYRKQMSSKGSKKYFSKTAAKVNGKNMPRVVNRGGIRL